MTTTETSQSSVHDALQLRTDWNNEVTTVHTLEDLTKFINKMTTFTHDKTTIIYGLSSAMVATMNYVNRNTTQTIDITQGPELAKEITRIYTLEKDPYTRTCTTEKE